MRRRSTLWFMLAAAWFVLLVLNVLRHRDKNTIVIGTAVAAFLVIGAMSRRQETKASRNRHLK
jgi:predicted lysophospholipase L1 biosynthesis ABC-type transport system permease subunit